MYAKYTTTPVFTDFEANWMNYTNFFNILPIINQINHRCEERTLRETSVISRILYYDVLKRSEDLIRVDIASRKFFVENGLHWDNEEDLFKKITTLNCSIACLQDMYVNYMGTYGDGVVFYHLWQEDRLSYIYVQKNGNVTGIRNSVIAFGHKYVMIYGHFIMDVLVPLMLVPEEIIKKSDILVTYPAGYKTEFLHALGIKDSQMLDIKENEWCFARTLYVSEYPTPHVAHFGIAIEKLALKLKNAFGIKEFEPTQYMIFNRNQSYRRHIREPLFLRLKATFQNKFPEVNWYKIGDIFPTQRETAIAWSSIKFLYAVTGSHMFRMIFMQKNTYVCCMMATYFDHMIVCTAIAMNISILTYSQSGNNHFRGDYYVDLNRAVEMMKILMYRKNNLMWPDRDQMKY